MKGKILGLAVIVVAMGVLVNALALTSATVKNNAINIPIVATDAALISIGAGSDVDVTFGTDPTGKQAKISVGTGLQADSSYTFESAFVITNRSATATKITIPNTISTSGVTVTLSKTDDSAITDVSVNATPLPVKMVVTVPSGQAASTGLNFNFNITGAK